LFAPIALAQPNACAAPCMVARHRVDVAWGGRGAADVAGPAAPPTMAWQCRALICGAQDQIYTAREPARPHAPLPASARTRPVAAQCPPPTPARGRARPRPATSAAQHPRHDRRRVKAARS